MGAGKTSTRLGEMRRIANILRRRHTEYVLSPRTGLVEYSVLRRIAPSCLFSLCLAAGGFMAASNAADPMPDSALGYQTPLPELQAIVDAPREPALFVAPDGHAVALVGRAALPPISIVAEPQARLAGIRFNPNFGSRPASNLAIR